MVTILHLTVLMSIIVVGSVAVVAILDDDGPYYGLFVGMIATWDLVLMCCIMTIFFAAINGKVDMNTIVF